MIRDVVQPEEREKAEYNLNHPEVLIDPRAINPSATKVAIKMNLMTFDTALSLSTFEPPPTLQPRECTFRDRFMRLKPVQ